MRHHNAIDPDLEYAVCMISTGAATAEQAAQVCGISLATLRAHMRESSSPGPATLPKAVTTNAGSGSAASTQHAFTASDDIDGLTVCREELLQEDQGVAQVIDDTDLDFTTPDVVTRSSSAAIGLVMGIEARHVQSNPRLADWAARADAAAAREMSIVASVRAAAAEEQRRKAQADAEAAAQRNAMQALREQADTALAELAQERRMREDAQSALDAERRAHEVTSQALQDLTAERAAERTLHEDDARALAEAQALLAALEIELAEAKAQRKSAIEAAYRHAERYTQIESEVRAERRAREEAEARAHAEQLSREEAAQALLQVRKALGLWCNA